MNAKHNRLFLNLLLDLGTAIRTKLQDLSHQPLDELAKVARNSESDTIYEIDADVEDAIENWFEQNWPSEHPVEIVMEGLDEPLWFPQGIPLSLTRFKIIIDPIDCTRGLMYDKRCAWFLAGLAEQRGPMTNLSDIFVSAMTELPTRKQGMADQLGAIRGEGRDGIIARRTNLLTGENTAMEVSPSGARNLAHGFACCVKFFPSGKKELAAFEEELLLEVHGIEIYDTALIFDDQYISTGGQLYELIMGHDRMVIDVRPMAYRSLGKPTALACHPYDLCCELVAREAGVIVQSPEGTALQVLLDTTSPVAWIGFANQALADSIGPVVDRLTRKHFCN